MDESPFYRPLSDELCQGDIFERIPLVHVKDEPRPLIKANLPKGRQGFGVGDPLDAKNPPKTGSSITVAAACDHTRAILLTYDPTIARSTSRASRRSRSRWSARWIRECPTATR